MTTARAMLEQRPTAEPHPCDVDTVRRLVPVLRLTRAQSEVLADQTPSCRGELEESVEA